MNVLIDINHPAHVHFFKNLYWKLKKEGHEVTVVASKKEINFELLENYNIPFINIGTYGKTLISKLFKLIWLDLKMVLILLRHRPNYVLGVVTIRGAHAGFLFPKTKVLVFTDTEHAKEQIALYKPFADKIFTPDCFTLDLGKKQVRYKGYHELAYTHPKYFEPDPKILREFGVTPKDTFFILRFVSWEATHDVGEKGFTEKTKEKLIKMLEREGRVFITSEAELPSKYEKYKINVSPEKIHHLMYYAKMYIGEGGTMASEAACLGTPAILVNSLTAGTFEELENKYKLLVRTTKGDEIIEIVKKWLNQKNLKKEFQSRRRKLLEDKIDVTVFIYSKLNNI